MAWLLDTNALSELKRPTPSHRVTALVAGCPLDQLNVSVLTLAEIRFGIERSPDVLRRAEIEQWLTNKIRRMFAERTQTIT